MTEPSWRKGPPATILLATDLSVRSDRALDRALQLAAQWGSRLIVTHAIEAFDDPMELDVPSWRRRPDPRERALQRLEADLGGLPGNVEIRIEPGRPADIVLAIAASEGADLIVTGVARDEALGRTFLGDTVHRLIRKAPAPLLIVRSRPRGTYRSIVVAADFWPPSQHALEASARFFPDADFTLFNAYDVPFATYLSPDQVETNYRRIEQEVAARFVAGADVAPDIRNRIGWIVEHGSPEQLLRDFVRDQTIDLTVVGSHGGGAIYDMVIGSTARRIIDAVESDVLLVRETKQEG